jgi:hypothetical protein
VAVANIAIEVNGQQAANALKQITTASRQLESAVNGTTTKINNQNKEIQTAANGMRYFTDATGRARAENGRFLSSTEKAAAGLNKQAAAANGLKGVIGELLGALALASTAKFVFAKTAEIETQTRSIEVLTGSLLKAKQIVSELQQYSNVTPFTSSEVIDTTKRLLAYGITSEKVVETTKRLGDVAGATGANLGELSLAYGQVMTKGRLMGEENMQFQERGIALQEELRKMYKMSGKEFSDAMSKGQISAEAVEVAVIRLTNKGGKYANGAIAQSDTLNGKFSTLTDSVENLARTVGTVFAPLFKWLLTEATNVISVITDAINMAAQGPQKAQVIAQIRAGKIPTASMNPVDYLTGNTTNNKLLEILGNGNLAAGDKILKQLARQSSKGPGYLPDPNKLIKLLQQQPGIKAPTAPTATTTNPPPLLAETGGRTGRKGKSDAERAAERAAKEAAKEAERVAQVIRDRLAEGQILQVKSGLQDKISAAEGNSDKMLATRLQGLQREIDIQYQYAQALAQEKDVRAQEAIIFEGNTKLVANQRDVQRELATIQRQREQEGLQSITDYLEKQYELNTAIQQQKALAESVSGTLGQGMTAVFDTLIQGSDNWGKSLQQIASKVLIDIANQLIRIYVIEQAVSAIKSFLSPALPFGGGGGQIGGVGTLGPNYGIKQFANGGVPPVGRPSLIGERGPELFMPGIRGTVIPNGGFGGGSTSVVVNVDASGNSNIQGDQTQAKQLGVVVSAAVQAELVKQQRPGGLLAGTRR